MRKAYARKLIELEGYLVSCVFFDVFVDTITATDGEASEYLQHTGKRTGNLFALKWVQH